MKLKEVRFLDGGHCVHLEFLTGVRSFCWRRIHATFVSFVHPEHGPCLIDTGYGPWIYPATRSLLERGVRWLTPIPRNQSFRTNDYWNRHSIDPQQVTHIFISHFHIDHIGSLRSFPNARLVYRKDAYDELSGMTRWQQIHQGYFSKLLPDDFEARGVPTDQSQLKLSRDGKLPFPALDYWGDGSLWLVDLPGHALGHTGYLMHDEQDSYFYATDAYWDRRYIQSERKLPGLARNVQHDSQKYEETVARLRQWEREAGKLTIACHCPTTQARFDHSGTRLGSRDSSH